MSYLRLAWTVAGAELFDLKPVLLAGDVAALRTRRVLQSRIKAEAAVLARRKLQMLLDAERQGALR